MSIFPRQQLISKLFFMSNQQNRIRKLAGLFSVDAWHAAFDQNNAVVDFFIDVTFKTGRYGGEEESEILFKASLSRATLIVVLPDGGTYTVDPESVIRTQPEKTQVSRNKKTSKTWSIGGMFKLSKSPGASAEASAKAGSTAEEFRTSSSEEFPITEQHEKDGENYCWALSSSKGLDIALHGPAWDSSIPRLKIRDCSDAKKRQKVSDDRMLEPSTVLIRCLREDLLINNIRYKDEAKNTLWAKNISSEEKKLKMIAAEAIIKKQLLDAGLEPPNIPENNAYAEIVLAEILVRIEKPMKSTE